jgi:prepilin-type processing-associated H-X9-DG protein
MVNARDGSSNTLMAGERSRGQSYTQYTNYWGSSEFVGNQPRSFPAGQVYTFNGSPQPQNYNTSLDKTYGPPGVNVMHRETGTVGANQEWYSFVNGNCNPRGLTGLPSRAGWTQFSSVHPHALNVAFADGSVSFISQAIDVRTYAALGTRAAGDMNTGSALIQQTAGPGTERRALNLAADTGSFPLRLVGQGVHTGNNFPTDVISLVYPFELQWRGPNDALTTGTSDHSDLKEVGVRTYRPQASTQSLFRLAQQPLASARILFGIATYANWRTPNEVAVNIFIDTNRDGTDDFRLVNTSLPNAVGAPSDVFVTRLQNLQTGAATNAAFLNVYSAAQFDTVPFNTNVMVLLVQAAALGLTDANARFTYQVRTAIGGVVVDQSPRLTYDPARPGLDFGSTPIFYDLPGQTIPVSYNRPHLQANGSLGALLIHHHNVTGKHEEVLLTNQVLPE